MAEGTVEALFQNRIRMHPRSPEVVGAENWKVLTV